VDNAALVTLSRQVALRRELDVVANNLANVNTNGFKGEHMTFEEYLMPVARADGFPRGDRRLSYVQDKASWRDFSHGAVEVTSNPLDVAIKGDAFFVVQTPAGERYTRDGSFQIDSQGRLVTSDGQPVMSNAGPITFAEDETDISIGKDGTISTNLGDRGHLRLVAFDDPHLLRAEGDSRFSSATPGTDVPLGSVGVVQGAIEKSNVQPVVETTRLIEITRAYQTLASMMQSSSELKQSAIQRLADIPV